VAAKRKVETRRGLLTRPAPHARHLLFGEGRLFVAGHRLRAFDPELGELRIFVIQPRGIAAMAVAQGTVVWLEDSGETQLVELPDGRPVAVSGRGVRTLAANRRGIWLLTESGVKLATGDSDVVALAVPDSEPVVMIGRGDNLFVAPTTDCTLAAIDTTTATTQCLAQLDGTVRALAADEQRVYATIAPDQVVATAFDGPSEIATIATLSGAHGLAVDGDHIFVGARNQVVRLTKSGGERRVMDGWEGGAVAESLATGNGRLYFLVGTEIVSVFQDPR
jgi:hypothetical protein